MRGTLLLAEPPTQRKTHLNARRLSAWGGLGFAVLAGVLLVLPLLLGGNRPWALGLAALCLWLALAGWALASWAQPHAHGALHRRLWGARGVALGPWPTARAPLAGLLGLAALAVAQLLAPEGSALATVDAFQTREHLLRTLLYTAAFALTVATAASTQLVRRVLELLVLAGLLQALLAVSLSSARSEFSLFHTVFEPFGRATGTFPNPDHLAGFMELCLSAGLGLLVAQLGGEQGEPGWRGRLSRALRFVMSPKMVLRLLLVVMVIALVLTRSRMGNGAFFLALLLVGALVAWRSRKLRQPALWLVASMVVVDIFVIGQLVGLEKVVHRLQGTDMSLPGTAGADAPEAPVSGAMPREESLEDRLQAPLAALALVPERPLWGHGGGTFEAVFPAARTPEVIPYQFDHAHNDYVEVAVEMGGLGLLLWVGVGVLAGWRALRLLSDAQPRLHRGVAVATLMALACLGMHSLVDFNLQIPANALTLSVLLALPFALPLTGPGGAVPASAPAPDVAAPPRAVGPARLGLLLALAVAAWVGWQALRTARADWAAAGNRGLLLRHEAQGGLTAESYALARERFERALSHTPEAPLLHAQLGTLHLAALQATAQAGGPDMLARAEQQLKAARDHYEQASAARPTDPYMWLGLANARFALGEWQPGWQAWREAMRRGPNEAGVRSLLFDYALQDWAATPPDVQAWGLAAFERAPEAERRRINAAARAQGLAFEAQ